MELLSAGFLFQDILGQDPAPAEDLFVNVFIFLFFIFRINKVLLEGVLNATSPTSLC